jgi:hypothetical protein
MSHSNDPFRPTPHIPDLEQSLLSSDISDLFLVCIKGNGERKKKERPGSKLTSSHFLEIG